MACFNKKQQVIRLTVPASSCREHLDQWVSDQHAELSRTLIRKVIDIGGAHLNGRRLRKCSHIVKPGDQLEIFLDQQPLTPFRLDDSHIVFKDGYVLAINKPSGIESQPTPARYKGTLYEALLLYLKNPYRSLDKPELGMVQRLDRETSGLMLFSIHRRAHKALTDLFQSRTMVKRYMALVEGSIVEDEGTFESMLARQRRTNLMKSVMRGGKDAITRYRTVARLDGCTLVDVEIPTGRMHQIRVHFSEAGHPLVGDVRYGGHDHLGDFSVKRTMLHSAVVLCDHPVTAKPLTLKAPLAEDFKRLLLALGWNEHDHLSAY